ncbi:hypothetical protein EV182_005584, partial [Spiromyces aspiralis]
MEVSHERDVYSSNANNQQQLGLPRPSEPTEMHSRGRRPTPSLPTSSTVGHRQGMAAGLNNTRRRCATISTNPTELSASISSPLRTAPPTVMTHRPRTTPSQVPSPMTTSHSPTKLSSLPSHQPQQQQPSKQANAALRVSSSAYNAMQRSCIIKLREENQKLRSEMTQTKQAIAALTRLVLQNQEAFYSEVDSIKSQIFEQNG